MYIRHFDDSTIGEKLETRLESIEFADEKGSIYTLPVSELAGLQKQKDTSPLLPRKESMPDRPDYKYFLLLKSGDRIAVDEATYESMRKLVFEVKHG